MTCSFWTFPAHSSLITKHPHAPISCKLFSVSFHFNFPCSKESRSSTENWVRDSSTDPSAKLQLLFLSIRLALRSRGWGKLLPQTWLQESSTCGVTLAHSWCTPEPRLLPVPENCLQEHPVCAWGKREREEEEGLGWWPCKRLPNMLPSSEGHAE